MKTKDNKTKMKENGNLRKEMISHIRSLNRYLSKDLLMSYDWMRLLALVHPIYREPYVKKLNDNGCIKYWEYCEILPISLKTPKKNGVIYY